MDRRSSPELPQSAHQAGRITTFEETYPRYEFAELVRLTLAAAAWLVGMRRRVAGRRPDISGRPLPGEINPAE